MGEFIDLRGEIEKKRKEEEAIREMEAVKRYEAAKERSIDGKTIDDVIMEAFKARQDQGPRKELEKKLKKFDDEHPETRYMKKMLAKEHLAYVGLNDKEREAFKQLMKMKYA